MLQDYKLGVRMLLKYPGLTIAGGLALAIAIGIGAGWYDLAGKLTLLADVGQCVAADARNRGACGARRQSTPCARDNRGPGHGADGEWSHGGRRPGAALRCAGGGPTGRPADDVVSFAAWIGMTSPVMLGAGLLACVEPARRALRINPIDALRDA